MGLFRRRKPLHERLAEAGGLGLAAPAAPSSDPIGQRPGWNGDGHETLVGLHGVPRQRRWDAVASADAPALRGDRVHFVALDDGTLVVEEDEPDDSLGPLADAVEASVPPPYRAEAVRRGQTRWAVAASRIAIARVSGLVGDQAELVVTRDGRSLHVDGRATLGRAPALERIGEAEGAEYVVRATRLDGDLWEVEATPL